MTSDKKSKYIGEYMCIHCKKEWDKNDIPDEKGNECPTAYKHLIVSKKKLHKICVKRKCVSWM